MFLALPFPFLTMYWWGIMMAGMNQTFSDKLPKVGKRPSAE